MARGQFKFFDVYKDGDLILSKAKTYDVALLLGISQYNLYDLANLNRPIKGFSVTYSISIPRKQKYFCQNCGKLHFGVPILYDYGMIGELRLCSDECKGQIINKIKGKNERKNS